MHTSAYRNHVPALAGGAPSDAASTSYQTHRAARAHRSFTLRERLAGTIQAAFEAACAMARRMLARYRQRRQSRAIYDALRQLNDHALRDLGFDRSEISSVAAEVTGEAARTRVRTLLTSNRFPK